MGEDAVANPAGDRRDFFLVLLQLLGGSSGGSLMVLAAGFLRVLGVSQFATLVPCYILLVVNCNSASVPES